MQCRCIALEAPSTDATTIPVAVQLKTPESEGTARVATHYIMILDTSESMADGAKLENVKHSASLVLPFLSSSDRVSIITFGDSAKVICSAVACTAEQKSQLQSQIDSIHVDGCTNLSGALLSLKAVLQDAESYALKTGVLLLTDGHANRGISNVAGLVAILNELKTQFPAVSIQLVGYGTDHNADMLRQMAQDTGGAYSIVTDREGAATVIGDSLGSLFSCYAQLVALVAPPGTTIEGTQYKVSKSGEVNVGELYEGGENILILSIPKEGSDGLLLRGHSVKGLEPFAYPLGAPTWIPEADRSDADKALHTSVALTKLRYKYSGFYRELRTPGVNHAHLKENVEAARAELDSFPAEHPIVKMLREEVVSLLEAIQLSQNPVGVDRNNLTTRIHQHEAFTTLATGVTQPINLSTTSAFVGWGGVPPQQGRARGYSTDSDTGNPTNPAQVHRSGGYFMSPTASTQRTRVARLTATMSQGGNQEAHDEAEEYSRQVS